MRKPIIVLSSIILIGICIYIMPRFIDFMESQNDIFKIKNENSQIFYIRQEEIGKIETNFNIPIPDDIKIKMKAREIEKRQKEEKERLAKIEAERIEKEKQEQIRLNKEQEGKSKAIEIAKETQITHRGTETPRSNSSWITFTASAYCGCSKCCGKSTGKTASGTIATQGRTVAMPNSYSFGTKIEIQGMGTYVVEDRGGAIKGNRIDIYFNNHQSALNFGKKTVSLRVVQ